MKLLFATDCWKPYVSGYVRTYETTVDRVREMGHEVDIISPYMFWRIPAPFYPEFPLPILVKRKVWRLIEESNPDAIHIGAEGPIGMAARRWCLRHDFPFTTSFTTKQPEYINKWCGLPVSIGYSVFRRFHAPSAAVMVSTESMRRELEERRFKHLVMWTRGVDLELFKPRPRDFLTDERPISLYVGRVAKEKNLPAFLDLKLPGTKYVVGHGPALKSLQKKHPVVRFVGRTHGEELASYYAAADVFVFPSRLDTFGLVLLESLASGTPVAAFPVTGPNDVVGNSDVAALDDDLEQAVHRALEIDRSLCRPYAERFSWDKSAEQFVANLRPKSPQAFIEQPHQALGYGPIPKSENREKESA